MRGLEKRLGVQLLARTTRSVSPTAAAAHLCMEKIYRRTIAQYVAVIGLDEDEEEFPLRLGLRY